jgi:hypothetical protein
MWSVNKLTNSAGKLAKRYNINKCTPMIDLADSMESCLAIPHAFLTAVVIHQSMTFELRKILSIMPGPSQVDATLWYAKEVP